MAICFSLGSGQKAYSEYIKQRCVHVPSCARLVFSFAVMSFIRHLDVLRRYRRFEEGDLDPTKETTHEGRKSRLVRPARDVHRQAHRRIAAGVRVGFNSVTACRSTSPLVAERPRNQQK